MAATYQQGGDRKGSSIFINIDDRQIADVEATLAGVKNGARNAIRSAINATLKKGRTDLTRAIREEVYLPANKIRDRISIPRQATSTSLSGTLKIDYRKVPLIDFQNRISKKKGVTARMLKSQPSVLFKHAFKATGEKQGLNIYERIKDSVKRRMTSGKYAGRLIKRGPRKGEPLLRQPLRRLSGISVVRVVEVAPGLQSRALANLSAAFQKQLASKIQWQLAKGKPNAPDFEV